MCDASEKLADLLGGEPADYRGDYEIPEFDEQELEIAENDEKEAENVE